MPMDERIRICRQALEISDRAEEASLVLGVLRQYPSRSGLELAVEMLDKPAARSGLWCLPGDCPKDSLDLSHRSSIRPGQNDRFDQVA